MGAAAGRWGDAASLPWGCTVQKPQHVERGWGFAVLDGPFPARSCWRNCVAFISHPGFNTGRGNCKMQKYCNRRRGPAGLPRVLWPDGVGEVRVGGAGSGPKSVWWVEASFPLHVETRWGWGWGWGREQPRGRQRATAAAVSPGGAWTGFSAPLPAQAAVNRARTPGQGRVSEDKALALLITSQDLEPGPKSRSGAGRPGRGSLL